MASTDDGEDAPGVFLISCRSAAGGDYSTSGGGHGRGLPAAGADDDAGGSGDGIAALLAAVHAHLAPQVPEGAAFVRARHVHHAAACHAELRRFLAQPPAALDLACEDLRAAVRQLGMLAGAVGVEEVLDRLFSEMCMGK